MIHNPILPGFNPDPCICRRGDDYFVATSTFEWFPGVQIHYSRDLVHWQLRTHALTRVSQLELRGIPSSAGIWAPCLSWDERTGHFYLIYTIVQNMVVDMCNYVVCAPDIDGPWSEPSFLNGSGFDPSLFHDDDGRKWLVNLRWEKRPGYPHPGPIVLQEYDARRRELRGPTTVIYEGCGLGCVEGPHIYKHDGWYYLLAAEGGTGYGHAVTMARSRTIDGTYAPCPRNPILSAAKPGVPVPETGSFLRPQFFNPDVRLQKTGHASLVSTPSGEWYMVHLCGRPLVPNLRCTLGRETAIQRVEWADDGWLALSHGTRLPADEVPQPALSAHPFDEEPCRVDFAHTRVLSPQFATLREPPGESWCSFDRTPGTLSLRGRESLRSWHENSLVARRVQAFSFEAQTALTFVPDDIRQYAGLVCYYDGMNWCYVHLYRSERMGRRLCVGVTVCDKGNRRFEGERCPVEEGTVCGLRARVVRDRLQFSFAPGGSAWHDIGPILDFSILSDEYAGPSFTGAFVGICCQDPDRRRAWAAFDFFEYREHPGEA